MGFRGFLEKFSSRAFFTSPEKYDWGYITEEDRYEQVITIWNRTTGEVKNALEENFSRMMTSWETSTRRRVK